MHSQIRTPKGDPEKRIGRLSTRKRRPLLLLVGCLLAGCASPSVPVTTAPTTRPALPTPAFAAKTLWISPSVPDPLRQVAGSWGLTIVPNANGASLHLDLQTSLAGQGSLWIYALVAPFPTILDGVSSGALRAVWSGSSSESFAKWPLWMTASTLSALSAAWGPPAVAVQVSPGDQLLDAAWSKMPGWAIIPFESIEPRWKVLTLDGQSPIRKDFDPTAYPLGFLFTLSSSVLEPPLAKLPATNRDPSKMTTVIMSGTSALVREIAYQMEVEGINYPGRDIGNWLREADVTHVSNEVSFDPSCPPPNPNQNRFYCSDPKYIELFDAAGVDVVELTGNHELDNGTASMLFTLKLYQEHNMAYFGGGANLADARKPLLLDSHGNKIAFVGCNAGEPPEPLATNNLPGVNPCDWKQLTTQIRQLRQQGYLPIVTFQYKEGYSPMVMPWQALDFRRAAEAGAVIVSGSQSHVPLEMEFYKGTFIHYGLGNLFFGQMGNQPPGPGLPLQPAERFEFLDRHVFYDGRYINTELLTALLEDYARPRPMKPDERGALLGAYFGYSGWLPLDSHSSPGENADSIPPARFPSAGNAHASA